MHVSESVAAAVEVNDLCPMNLKEGIASRLTTQTKYVCVSHGSLSMTYARRGGQAPPPADFRINENKCGFYKNEIEVCVGFS